MILYSYSLMNKKWNRVSYLSPGSVDTTTGSVDTTTGSVGGTPGPRSAHQFVKYGDFFFLFGGNISEKTEKRKNDLWRLEIKKKNVEDVKDLIKYTIRKYKYLKLLEDGKDEEAVRYLRSRVREKVKTEEMMEEYEELCYEAFEKKKVGGNILEELMKFFPEKMHHTGDKIPEV